MQIRPQYNQQNDRGWGDPGSYVTRKKPELSQHNVAILYENKHSSLHGMQMTIRQTSSHFTSAPTSFSKEWMRTSLPRIRELTDCVNKQTATYDVDGT
jgi:hypothetical protein